MSTGHEKNGHIFYKPCYVFRGARNVVGVRRPRNARRAVSIIDSCVDFGAENEEVDFI